MTTDDPTARGPNSGAGGVPPMLVPVNNLTRYLRVRLEVGEGMMRWEVPRTLLGIIPIGTRRVQIPLEEVAAVRIARVVQPLLLLIGLALIVAPWFWLPWWAALPLLLVGIWVSLVSMGPRIEVRMVSGRTRRAPVCFGHQLDAELYLEVVKDLSGR